VLAVEVESFSHVRLRELGVSHQLAHLRMANLLAFIKNNN
jgi:hypothetical protein